MTDVMGAFVETTGGNRRAMRRKQARMFDGAKRPTTRSKMLDRLPASYDPRNQTSDRYYVKTVTSTVCGVDRERNARLVLREPTRRIPDSEKPSKVIRSKAS
jgi:hypothetical protein